MTASLANRIEDDHALHMFCDAFKRVADIDVEAIAAKYGRSVMLTEIGAKARCNECGGLGSYGGRVIEIVGS